MARMTEEEAWALSDHFTNNEYTLGPDGSDWLSWRERQARERGGETLRYILKEDMADCKPSAGVVDEPIGERIASAV